MDELYILVCVFLVIQLVAPAAFCFKKEFGYAAASLCVGVASFLVLYMTVVKTAYVVEAECRKPLIGISVNK